MSLPPSRRPRRLTEEEIRLWRTAMQDAVPLDRPDHAVVPVVTAVAPPPPAVPAPDPLPSPSGSAPSPPSRPSAPAKPALPSAPPAAPVWPPGLDRRTDQRLRRGLLAIDARIDLHGMNQATAHAAVVAFLLRCSYEGRRCVLVITGKGTPGEGGGVLRHALPRWLAETPTRPIVIAHAPAQPRHGGDGALYVLLKRRRPAS